MKLLSTLVLIIISSIVYGQKANTPTDDFFVKGQLQKELRFTLDDIEKFPKTVIEDVVITNHLGEARGIAKKLTGVLMKNLLRDLKLKEDNPKRFSEFYLTFVAVDNYKVVYSWNEIFNSPTGDNLFLITSRDGKKLKEMEERILILTPTDFKTGRRHIKGLSKILVDKVN